MDQLQTRLDTLEQQMHTVNRRLRWWRGLACGLVGLAVLAWMLPAVIAQEDAADKGQQGLAQRVAALETLLKHVSREGDDITIKGANLHLVNGLGQTACGSEEEPIPNCPNGLGNLIVGYNEPREFGGDIRTGSHNVVVGKEHNFSRFGGLVVGVFNEISGDFAAVSGGFQNTASGSGASVSGGCCHRASGEGAAVSGGEDNTASGEFAAVSGGEGNLADGGGAVVSGGGGIAFLAQGNTASGFLAVVIGGHGNTASGGNAVVSGGAFNTASGPLSVVSGGGAQGGGESPDVGSGNEANGLLSVVTGGSGNLASGDWSTVSGGGALDGGSGNTASGVLSSIGGGQGNTASGQFSSVSGGLNITQETELGWSAGSEADEVVVGNVRSP